MTRSTLRLAQGNIVSVTDSTGSTIAINSYDEWGIPAPTNVGQKNTMGLRLTIDRHLKIWFFQAIQAAVET